MNGLDHFEALAEHLVEGTFERIFRPRLHPSEVARRLARAMEDGQVVAKDDLALLPNRYWVFLNPDDFAALDASGEQLRSALLRYLQRLATEGGANFGGPLRVDLHPLADLGIGQLNVRAAHGSEPMGADDTQGVKIDKQSAVEAERWSLQLGERIFRLGEPVIRVGRALGNDVILDDRHISRRHAQLRWRAGTYHLSDMGSSLGTTLNGRPIGLDEAVPLAGGDEISLAGIVLAVHVGSAPSEGDV